MAMRFVVVLSLALLLDTVAALITMLDYHRPFGGFGE
jgi:hypothetical protein